MNINKLAAFLMLVGFFFSACKKDKMVTPTPITTGSFELMSTKIFAKSCAFSNCHASGLDQSYAQHGLILKGDLTEMYHELLEHPVKNQDALNAGLAGESGRRGQKFFLSKIDF
jgi:hypothetical protein